MTSRNPIGSLPAVFGRYLLLRRLSRGGMGEIFLGKVGEIEGFEKPIVIKKILPDLAADQEFLQLFIEEAQIAIKLAHSNIVPVYEVGMAQSQYFLAMQYVEGRDLRALLTRANEHRRNLTPDLALFIAREIANGLAYAHRRTDEHGEPLDLVHCDISPPNVLVSWEGEVKIIDFGIAKSAMQRAAENEDVGFGKFGYMAPEQLIRGATVDRRADIYSTGVLLYELLTGKRLFNFPPGVDYRRVARDVTAGRYALPSEANPKLGESFNAVVLRALATDPSQRYQSAEELRDAVQQQLYSMNPTISADTLAALMRDLYADDISADRKMLSELSGTDLQPFQHQLHDGTSHTVSIALGAGLISSTSSIPYSFTADQLSAMSPSVATSGSLQPSFGRITPRAPTRDDAPTGTRQLGSGERRAAAALQPGRTLSPARDPGSLTAMVGRDLSRRRTVLISLGAALAAAAIVLSVVFWPGGDQDGGRNGSGAKAALAGSTAVEAGTRESAGSGTAAATGATGATGGSAIAAATGGDGSVHIRFAPDPVNRTDAAAPTPGSGGGTAAGTAVASAGTGNGSSGV
ncbi:MAG: serine/threonine protein kinase, partial [Myxococcales bacterium]|nr:serine/threonine protein kinase [Myxococcales bacterium]